MLLSHEELFIRTVQDLRTKIRTNTAYSLIRGCGLCRHLLLDTQPLLHQANKKHKIPIRFHVKDYTNSPLSYEYKGSGGRTVLPLGESKFVKLEEFLKTKIHYYGKHEFTVFDILDAACHYYGGIHSGKPDAKQEFLAKLNWFVHKETNISFWHMGAICKVVLKAIKPLETLIKNNPPAGGFSPLY
jgi:hypothetical protein